MMTRDTIVIAGATGFVGHAVAERLAARRADTRLEVVGLTRGRRDASGAWDRLVACDLFSLKDVEQALAGARYVAYLVHSMLPSARLVQGTFSDLDLICADNVGRAAAGLGIEQIIYLGGLIPENERLSAHLASRLEVERALGAHGVPVTTLRAGLVIGKNGSSFEILARLVRRLPAMVLPSWTERRCQPIDLATTASLIDFVVGRPETYGQTFDIGGPDILCYRDMLAIVGEELGTRRPSLPVPLLSPRLSRLWISLITGAPATLVAPLVESLRHDLVCRDRRLQAAAALPGLPFRDAVTAAIGERGGQPQAYRAAPHAPVTGVRSVQRIHLPQGRDAEWAAHEYMRWLPDGAGPLRVDVSDHRVCRFYLLSMARPLLELTFAPDRSSPDRQLFYVTGGMLARPTERGRLEFRVTPDGAHLLAAIHDFAPRLPWPIYRWSQALVHRWVMHRFDRHLAALTPVPPPPPYPRATDASGDVVAATGSSAHSSA
ncbi:MAG: NAD-dependent epimerase/dehydratase family protein [Kofleriaceae bacterium]|nr:NAD-dependent epimerase/dehydratase family protein [Kofleriaceae bacterium]